MPQRSEPNTKATPVSAGLADGADAAALHAAWDLAARIRNAKWLAQGTIYPDVIESAGAVVDASLEKRWARVTAGLGPSPVWDEADRAD